MDKKPEKPMGDKPIRHFWAFIVWNYNDQAIQILEITQATIQSTIQNLYRDSDWGAPYGYDIKIVRKGQELNTEYSVTPAPKKAIDPEIHKLALEKPAYLDALFDGEDPWLSQKQTPLEIDDLPF